jgi:hypothetical protein
MLFSCRVLELLEGFYGSSIFFLPALQYSAFGKPSSWHRQRNRIHWQNITNVTNFPPNDTVASNNLVSVLNQHVQRSALATYYYVT